MDEFQVVSKEECQRVFCSSAHAMAFKRSTEIGHFILPIAAIRGEGTSDDNFPPEVPALASFKVHKFVSEKIVARGLEYRNRCGL